MLFQKHGALINKFLTRIIKIADGTTSISKASPKGQSGRREGGMRPSSFLVGIAGAAIFVSSALAEDHPCVQARDPFVVALCSDPELRTIADQQREEMMALWNRLPPQEQDKFRNDQLAWRDFTARRCTVDQPSLQPLSAETKNCLKQAEARRIEFLRHYGQPDTPTALHPNALPQVASPTSVAVTDDQGATGYQDGLRDRAAWEEWFNSLQGDYKTGALYWATRRSLPHPGSCQQINGDFYAGCTQAKIKLSRSDTLRKTGPNYKAGWNAWAPSEPSAAPSVQNVPPAVAPPVAKGASSPTSNPVYEYQPSVASKPEVAARIQQTTTTTSTTAPTTIEKTPDGQTTNGMDRDGDAIRQHCLGQWPSDFAMRAYCERKQREAVGTLGKGRPEDISADDFTIIRGKCATDWPDDFAMRAYCESKQYEAVRALRKSAETQLQPSFSAPPPKTAPTDNFGFKELESIIDASQNNEARFNRDYKGKVFSDVGVLKSVDERSWLIDRNQVHVEAPNGWRISSSTVYCFPKLDSSETANWPSRMPIKITGTIHYTVMGDLSLEDCQLKPLR
jgi:hypothetical protein